MRKYLVYIALFVLLVSCKESKPDFPKSFAYNGSTFDGPILTYNSTGELLSITAPFSQSDFLFSKDQGIYPIDDIVLNAMKAAQFHVSNSKSSFILEGDYLISNNKILFDIYFSSSDTLRINADYNTNKLSISAFGFKIYGPNDGGGTLISSAQNFGAVEISKILSYAKPTDTICIQKFIENYREK